MPMIDLTIPADAFDRSTRAQLADDLLAILLRWEGAPPTQEAASLAWAFVHVVDEVRVGQGPPTRPHYRVGVRTPAGALDDRRRAGLVAEVTDRVLAAEGAAPTPANRFRVWVILDDVPDGAWGAEGRIWRFPDVAAFVTARSGPAGLAHR
jgi:phenylpyruvate tautomerase PptA (4-oxalocrotonate tautomerase family)